MTIPQKSKACYSCKVVKPLEDFHIWQKHPTGRNTKCKECRAVVCAAWNRNRTPEQRAAHAERSKAWRIANPIKSREGDLRSRYGIGWENFLSMLNEQNGCCAICKIALSVEKGRGVKMDRAHVDHCHSTGSVRGLLCTRCNAGLGMFTDSRESLLEAVKYLDEAEARMIDITPTEAKPAAQNETDDTE